MVHVHVIVTVYHGQEGFIPTGHSISNIYHLGVLTKPYIGPFGSLYKNITICEGNPCMN